MDRAAEMLSNGRSYGDIAEAIGMTRSAVAGKMWRMGLKANVRRPGPLAPERLLQLRQAREAGLHRMAQLRQEKLALAFQQEVTVQLPLVMPKGSSRPVTIMQLASHHCRYPVEGEPGKLMCYCGKPRTVAVYCAEHGALCYRWLPGEAPEQSRRQARG